MSAPGNLSEQILALPSGAGAVSSGGQTFSANPQTGTGSYSIPIDAPAGPGGLAPALTLSYSTHGGNGIAGLGWSLGIASVERRTDKGVPTYVDADDTFALQGDELLPVGGDQFRLRIETRFARVRRLAAGGKRFWMTTERDGTRVFYGLEPEHRLHDGPGREAAWYASRKQDPSGNEVSYAYVRDVVTRAVLLTEVTWGGCYRIRLEYEARPDPIRGARVGFEHLLDQRLKRIRVEVRKTSDGEFFTFKTWDFAYQASRWTGRSLLGGVTVTGYKPDDTSRVLPSLTFAYAERGGAPAWRPIAGSLPGESLADRNVTLVQGATGLSDILETRATGYLLRENLGDGTFAAPRAIASPALVRLDQPGTFLSDMDGDGWADLVVGGGAYTYRGVPGGGWSGPVARGAQPSVDLNDPACRTVDIDNDGLPDLVRSGPSGWLVWRNRGDGSWAGPSTLLGAPSLKLDDPRVHFADLSGDGLPDLVYVEPTRIRVFRCTGVGRWAPAIVLSGSPSFGAAFDPRGVRFVDLSGSGAADLLYERDGVVSVAWNLGDRLGPLTPLVSVRQTGQGHVEPCDLFGGGGKGLLFTDRGGASWRYLDLFPEGNPDLLTTITNGLGAVTTLTYGSSARHAAADRRERRPWKTTIPMSQRVIDAVTTTDAVTGNRLGVRYRYHHGVYDGDEREFRGFAEVEQIEQEAVAGDPQPLSPTRVRRWYHTGTDLDLRTEYCPVSIGCLDRADVPKIPWALRALRGQSYREETFALDGNPSPYLVSETRYRVFPVGRAVDGRRASFAPLPIATRSVYTERSAEFRRSETTITYDLHRGTGYGLPVEVREKGFGRLGTFTTDHEAQQQEALERLTRTTYVRRDVADGDVFAAYTPSYCVGKPSVVETFAVVSGVEALLGRERLFYDGADYEGEGFPGSSTTIAVTRGRLSARLVLAFTDTTLAALYPTGSGAGAAISARGHYITDGAAHYLAAERTAYNANGTVAGARDPNGNTATIANDGSYGLFPVSAIDPAGHPTALTRGELPFQVQSTLDANGNTVSFVYDASGLPASKAVQGKYVSGAWQGDPSTHPTEQYEYDFTTTPIRVTTKTRQARLGATFDVHKYIDGLGRAIQERHTAEPDPDTSATRYRVTGWQVFNHKGLVVRAYQPTFVGSTSYAEGDTETAFVSTTYDSLGRPVRVDYPDGTYETTDYHPWVQTARDRNDNAAGIAANDARYGAHRQTFAAHLDTPTKKYVDALGRDIAVAEDNGAAPTPTFRVTSYAVAAGAFTGTTYDLTLAQNLASNYFVMLHGVVDNSTPDAASSGVRVTHDPNGTGDLGTSSGANVIRLSRALASGDWVGTVVIWESLGNSTASGFTLLDVKAISAASTSSGTEQITTATSGTAWSSLGQVALYGGVRGGGATTGGTTVADHQALFGRLTASGANTLELSRWRPSGTLSDGQFTVYVVAWGSEHQIQHVTVTGTASGDGIDTTGEYATASLTTPVRRSQSWASMSGWTKTTTTGDAFTGLALNLGPGPQADDEVCSLVSVGSEFSADRSVRVTVHTHPNLSVHWIRKDDGDSGAASKDVVAATAGETETIAGSNPTSTVGLRAPVLTTTAGTNNTRFDQSIFDPRHTAARTLTLTRAQSGIDFVAWAQSIDTVGVSHKSAGDPAIHVTRTVLDLRDQPIAVWDARGLAAATWIFEYDYASRRITQEHTTGSGKRWLMPAAANSPIWSRDARAIEADRTFDALNRPLTESSTASGTTKLRRAWRYLEYDEGDTDFATNQGKNLYGRVEEERDTDGLRFFEYDWRGLPTRVSHRFWDVSDGSARDWADGSSDFWTTGSSWDPATPSTARGSITSWLGLTDLTDTTTIAVPTSYDAAGRATEVTYPESMRTKATYNLAGMVEQLELDRGTGSGYEIVMQQARFNARGQPTSHLAGNGVLTTKEYDPDIERLLRIFTKLPGTPDVRLQDGNYAYDPAGNPVQITDALAETSYRDNQVIPNTRTFRYDPRYRLVRATGKRHASSAPDKTGDIAVPTPTWGDYEPYTIRYSYDEVGNFTTNQEYKSGTNNLNYKADRIDLFNGDASEATSSDPTLGNYTYDADGNTLKTPRIAALVYTHDDQARFVDMGGGGVVRYLRHADQRVLRFVNKTGVKSLRIYLGAFEYERRTGTTAYTKLTLHAEGAGVSCQAERVLAGSDSASLSRFWRHQDHLGSAQILTKADGTLLSQEEYYPYGRPSDRRDSRNRYRYIAVERDEDTGLCMTGPRTYDPVVGRFLQQDALAAQKSYCCTYSYAPGTPILRSDPSGYGDDVQMPVAETHGDLSQRHALGAVKNGKSLAEKAGALGLKVVAKPDAADPSQVTAKRAQALVDAFAVIGASAAEGNTWDASRRLMNSLADALPTNTILQDEVLAAPSSLKIQVAVDDPTVFNDKYVTAQLDVADIESLNLTSTKAELQSKVAVFIHFFTEQREGIALGGPTDNNYAQTHQAALLRENEYYEPTFGVQKGDPYRQPQAGKIYGVIPFTDLKTGASFTETWEISPHMRRSP